ncbi:MAG: response regulator [Clostridia bacterium]|nr:response regulator [Clostridia bacterium]
MTLRIQTSAEYRGGEIIRILIAEDEHYSRVALRQLILRFDSSLTIDEAKDGDEANAMLERDRYHLLICDIRMPGVNGLEVSSQAILGARVKHVVLLTGYADFQYAIDALRIGVRDYLLKPVDPEKLFAILKGVRSELSRPYHDEIVEKLNTYLEEHFDKKLSIAEVCKKQLHLHPAYVSRHYKKVTNETIMATLQRLRMERAISLLIKTQSPVSKICEQCGYSETSAFIQAFRKTYGMTPLEFRANNRRPTIMDDNRTNA